MIMLLLLMGNILYKLNMLNGWYLLLYIFAWIDYIIDEIIKYLDK